MEKRKRKPFKIEYCALLVKIMSKGGTINQFANKVQVSTDTVARWANTYPEFMDAKDVGHYQARMFNNKRGKQ